MHLPHFVLLLNGDRLELVSASDLQLEIILQLESAAILGGSDFRLQILSDVSSHLTRENVGQRVTLRSQFSLRVLFRSFEITVCTTRPSLRNVLEFLPHRLVDVIDHDPSIRIPHNFIANTNWNVRNLDLGGNQHQVTNPIWKSL